MFFASNYWLYNMHTIETSIIISIVMFFVFSFLSWTFKKELNISKEINTCLATEISNYKNETSDYIPQNVKNITNVILDNEMLNKLNETKSIE